MPDYKAPLQDVSFVQNEVFNSEQHYAGLSGCEQVTPDLLKAIMEEGAKISEQTLHPLMRSGDEEGCKFENGQVTTPTGFKNAWNQWCEGGWQTLGIPQSEGGQGLPNSVGAYVAEASLQGAVSYARERLQMRSLTGKKNPEGDADPIIVHPDVRRMLMTQKAFTEGSRAFVYWLAQLVDHENFGTDEQKSEAVELMGLLTPIAKAFCTEVSQEVTNLGVQVFGGHGFIAEHGMEQIVRDGRISTIYEGTTGIQAIDLVGRKILGSKGKLLARMTNQIDEYCQANRDNEALSQYVEPMLELNQQWQQLTGQMGEAAMKNMEEAGAASVDYLMYFGYLIMGYLWLQMANVAQRKQAEGNSDPFYKSKVTTAQLYFQRILPRAQAHRAAVLAGGESMMELTEDEFVFV